MFAWLHADMKGNDPKVITHDLNVDPDATPIQQKRCRFSEEKNRVIGENVNDLLQFGSIREEKYPRWVSNCVILKK